MSINCVRCGRPERRAPTLYCAACVQINSLEQWVADLHSGMFVNCVYCGHRYGPADKVPGAMADVLKEHIASCPKHPMSGLLRSCIAAHHLINSLLAVREGATDDLLREILQDIDQSIAATKPGVLHV
jgi:Zn ribbon nucleic-acid-binding protein